MKFAVFHGSPRKGNTYIATKIFMDELSNCDNAEFTEFFLPKAMPKFCTGCQLCLGNPYEKCPHSEYTTPILDAIIDANALIFTTPHHGACDMSACMKNLLDHLDFLTMNVAPRRELFGKKAFIITTGAGSAAAIKPIKKYLKNWGMNRVHALGISMLIDKWEMLTAAKQVRFEKRLRKAAKRFYASKKGLPYASTVFMYHMSKLIIKRYVGKDAYPYQYWDEQGYFSKRPF